ncbi:phosphatase PAP2 family protein [Halorubrum vacuolatum]|uniref:PAP2 superfamily protein n=1 Tax=Halorubrum vacuolatum TaxID=63740 RepID=A0A238UMU6_HALVU|nr:phosphatase PAP2 family protein [Halorubrum vacuolatum]SNR23358.1 PAP2 superfamily protein [Halorubrum vacuolatum]
MSLLLSVALVTVVLAVTAVSLAVLCLFCVDRERLSRLRDDRVFVRRRLRAVAPFIAVLAAILAINKGLQTHIVAFSYAYGVEPTATFHAIEGDVVATIQAAFPEWATLYFSGVYVFGYAVLLTFPLVAYVFASSTRPLKTLVAAYAVNYGVAVVCYAAVRAYGPRTFHAESESAASVSHGLVELFPDIVYLTSLVNSQTNVFPSLHTSLSVTVLAIAVLTHDEFPRWTPIAFVLATSIVVSTMALGIHWLIDVIAGVGLATVSVVVARQVVSRGGSSPPEPTVHGHRRGTETD